MRLQKRGTGLTAIKEVERTKAIQEQPGAKPQEVMRLSIQNPGEFKTIHYKTGKGI